MDSSITETKDKPNQLVDQSVQADVEIETDDDSSTDLIYGVLDTPPLHITIISGLQVWLFCFFSVYNWFLRV